jgi:para-nitrobenzyl esterase
MEETEVIETSTGKIQGYIDKGIHIFKGIPFAEPPIGDLRFKPPVKKKPWEGLLDTTKYGQFPMQGNFPINDLLNQILGLEVQESEDCLTLNIWTPNTDDKRRPVLVWIYGGGFIVGGSANPIYDGLTLALRGEVVVVSINYRVGAFGFLYIPGVTANAGLLDQIAALKWIQKNIGFFGGDPLSVTIFGQSAGGCSCIALMGMPAAKGLFRRVIAQSAPILQRNPTIKSTSDLMKELGLKSRDIKGLQKIEPEDIIAAQNKILKEAAEADEDEFMGFRPSVDREGGTLPIHPLEALKKGEGRNIDLMIGCTEEEMKMHSLDPSLKDFNSEKLGSWITSFLRPLNLEHESETLIQKYVKVRKDLLPIEPFDIFFAICSDLEFRIPNIHIAEVKSKYNSNVYFYIFTWPSPLFKAAAHFGEVPFVFGTVNLRGMKSIFGRGPDAKMLSEKVMDTWITFARSGNPNHANFPEWPVYDTEKRATMMIGKEFKVVNAPFEKERVIWDDLPEI